MLGNTQLIVYTYAVQRVIALKHLEISWYLTSNILKCVLKKSSL